MIFDDFQAVRLQTRASGVGILQRWHPILQEALGWPRPSSAGLPQLTRGLEFSWFNIILVVCRLAFFIVDLHQKSYVFQHIVRGPTKQITPNHLQSPPITHQSLLKTMTNHLPITSPELEEV